MTIDEQLNIIVSNLPSINPSRNYWLVRTQGGDYYQDFIENNFIAIEPSNVTSKDLADLERKAAGNEVQLVNFIKDFIKTSYYRNNKRQIANRTVGLKTNQIITFVHEIKEGDIIIIPSHNSSYISIGEITESKLAEFKEEELNSIKCPYDLRKKVRWLKKIQRSRLDVNLYMLFTTHNTISHINKYANIIERSVNDFYILYENAHLIINVNTQSNISAKDLFGFGHLLLEMLDEYATYYDIDVSSNDVDIQINLNSPGKLDLKSKIKKTTLILGLLTFLGGGGYEDKEGHKFKTDGLPGIVKSIIDYQNASQDRHFRQIAFNKYIDSLHIKNPSEFNEIIKQFSSNKDLPKH